MNFPIVKVTTKDGFILHGYLAEPERKSDTIVIHMHGSAGNFYQSNFYPYLFTMARVINIAFLTTNSRGSGVYEVEKNTKNRGVAIEIFEECLLDIDAWIEFALSKGYKKIILEGHSFGTNKIQYYALNGEYKDQVIALILLGFTDSYGGQLEYLERVQMKNEDVLKEADSLIQSGKPFQLLSEPLINWGELPQSAQSYKNFMTPGSELSKILPLREAENLLNFKKIQIPVLGIVGDRDECTVILPGESVRLLNKENKNAQCFMIENCNHSYQEKEGEMIKLVKAFIEKIIQN